MSAIDDLQSELRNLKRLDTRYSELLAEEAQVRDDREYTNRRIELILNEMMEEL